MHIKLIKNQRGQGLIEYLIIVALIGVAAIGVTSLIGQNVKAQFSKVALALQGKNTSSVHMSEVRKSHYEKRDMGDFFKGSAIREDSSRDDNE